MKLKPTLILLLIISNIVLGQSFQQAVDKLQSNADALEKLMYWRNVKIKIIIALCVIGLVGFIVMIIVLKIRETSS